MGSAGHSRHCKEVAVGDRFLSIITLMPRVKIGGFLDQTLADLGDCPAPPRVSKILFISHLEARIFTSPFFLGFWASRVPRLDALRRAVQDRPILSSSRPPGAELRPIFLFLAHSSLPSLPEKIGGWCPAKPFFHRTDWAGGFGVQEMKSLSTRGGQRHPRKNPDFFDFLIPPDHF